jgi:hypothetical protein
MREIHTGAKEEKGAEARYFGFRRQISDFNKNSPTIEISSAGPAHVLTYLKNSILYTLSRSV